jgi:hypothetical protein|tara:strand:- start:1450 stop:1647 length:198 start_codon:yes stop_codon:yes gene_type:complete
MAGFGGSADLDRLDRLLEQGRKSLSYLLDIGCLPAVAATGHTNTAIGGDPVAEPIAEHVAIFARE